MSSKDILTVKVTGHDELVRDLRKASKEIQDEARKILNSQAKVVRDHIKSRCPVGGFSSLMDIDKLIQKHST